MSSMANLHERIAIRTRKGKNPHDRKSNSPEGVMPRGEVVLKRRCESTRGEAQQDDTKKSWTNQVGIRGIPGLR